ncbi:B12-binding domain-containing radical SAM protein [Chondromyces crocatus]|uniref:Radical SAM methyltransferase n=1 Tax=Chondromyces crocatus TaxID=52 RepID=B9ZUJ4_CHOCO|nr:B12-binding domain-containing radical SAM protein [Chondromyces crocatus]AKT41162.1 uncharacterized protein CMC5_053230 [Chondromyces crocatus]CAQ43073.1 radical SAM methyltransferase [Chondromyces crocatus]
MATDILVIVPVEPPIAHFADSVVRQTSGGRLHMPLTQAFHEFEEYVGAALELYKPSQRPHFGGEMWPPVIGTKAADFLASRAAQPPRRTLASITLATHLERAGLRWEVVDPGMQELHYWRKRFEQARANNPTAIAICTTFIVCEPWLRALCHVIREVLPSTKIIMGGYYYAVNVKKFLALDADIFCVGEGEQRLPAIVQALKGQRSLEEIPGLYIRRPDGGTHHTGSVEQLDMNELPIVDWSLSTRVEPPIDPIATPVATWVETQRGCVFSCEFCDYRTIQTPAVMTTDRAAEAILAAGVSPRGSVRITDSTATFPHKRWEEVLQKLIERGGSKAPLWCFARVSDINERSAELMKLAGVQHMFIGQESGDQRVLTEMKKGTNVKQVRPAVAALAKHGLNATFAFIHGFPGEDDASIQATRTLIKTLNDGHEDRPVALLYLAQPLVLFDLATVSQRPEMQGVDHWMAYDNARFPPQRALAEVLQTVMEVSRIPHAPAYLLMPGTFPGYWEEYFFFSPHRYEVFRWMKALERGVAIFLERDLEGTKPNDAELARLKEQILARREAIPVWRSRAERMAARAQRLVVQRLTREWTNEGKTGPGPLTRGLMGLSVLRDTRNPQLAREALKTGVYPTLGTVNLKESELDSLAADLRDESLGVEHRRRQVAAARKAFVPASALSRRGPNGEPVTPGASDPAENDAAT